MKNAVQIVASWALFRWPLLLLMRVSEMAGGLVSRLKTGCLLPEAARRDCYINWSTRVKHPENITVGWHVRVGSECVLGAMGGISLGDYVRLSKGVIVETGSLDFSGSPPYPHVAKPIYIEDGVWIGTNAIVIGGVRIGRNSIIAAGSVVIRDVPPNVIAAGNPAKVVRTRTSTSSGT